MRIRFAAALSCLGIFALQDLALSEAPAAVGEGYVLATRGHRPPPGTRILSETSSSLLNGKKAFNAKGRSLEAETTQELRQTWENEQLTGDSLRHLFLAKSLEGATTANGRTMPLMTKPSLLVKTPLIVTRVEGKWVARLEKGDAGEEFEKDARPEIESVSEGYNTDIAFAIYGDTPRKPGDRWVVDGAKLASFAGVTAPQGQMEVHFMEVKDFQETKCALLDLKFSLHGKEGKGRMNLQGTGTVHRSISDQVDLLTELRGQLEVSSSEDPVPPIKTNGTLDLKTKTTVRKP
jgi:hypothetical protein